MDKTVIFPLQTPLYYHFFSISRIPSPQRLQNLVNYHPIFCPNAGDCSFFVWMMSKNDATQMGFLHLAGHVVGSSTKILNIPGGFHGCRCQQTFGNDAVFWSY
ncbi:hypothetical protein [Klebsiella spallanzanii]|uniref:hypothetical protein n=1 Tax=Klebsiella spallanzanii TaxID=2587528 RepID=UPI00115C307B|nr:hypothetical protein [Klebsiella spallanzanii]MDM4205449.1 hypothetical protein [Klebsiella spallanzanii]